MDNRILHSPPGPARRRLALQFCEIMNREVEYIALSQDTTESDLKQRREILGGAAVFADQAPVRAAVHGRILILDGNIYYIQQELFYLYVKDWKKRSEMYCQHSIIYLKIGDFVLLREMALEDGRYLMKASRYSIAP
ncbi:unnamed protein product [Aphanomyces euteiches]